MRRTLALLFLVTSQMALAEKWGAVIIRLASCSLKFPGPMIETSRQQRSQNLVIQYSMYVGKGLSTNCALTVAKLPKVTPSVVDRFVAATEEGFIRAAHGLPVSDGQKNVDGIAGRYIVVSVNERSMGFWITKLGTKVYVLSISSNSTDFKSNELEFFKSFNILDSMLTESTG